MGLDLTGIGSVADLFGKVIDKIFPDKNVAEKAKIQFAELAARGDQDVVDLLKGQAAITLEEAKSGKLWVAGWRPYIGWICGTAIGCYFIPLSLMSAIIWVKSCIMAGWVMKPFISPFDIGQLFALVFAMMGVSLPRTIEKIKGVNSQHG